MLTNWYIAMWLMLYIYYTSFQCEFTLFCCCSGTWWLLFTSTIAGKTVKLAAMWMGSWRPMETSPGLSTPVTWVANNHISRYCGLFFSRHFYERVCSTVSVLENHEYHWMNTPGKVFTITYTSFKTIFCCRNVYENWKANHLSVPFALRYI